ncbi:baculoviral IAP repeat-containing protein 3-like [Saccostrea echinata]|uniref:baculoviral IAP repeat-containing protein 3-like n=1 Tax=Saccostrea echinata TaxID=191078 RepID=UPI002A7FB802|nr:baculoviral IAP repeat-containing protein 3-like [Saccostrea echinata]XP_061177403.1 baculoviral IAP repeat-containing protein 3-like [Saccostrea echinata]
MMHNSKSDCSLLYDRHQPQSTSYDEFGSGANVPDSATRTNRSPNSPLETTGGHTGDKALRLAREYGINVSKPKYQQYAVKATRLKTFENWPSFFIQKPDDLVDAGFFYSGKGDAVFCFFCGLGLQEWEEGDTPWGEHARWSPECVFVINVKGRDFIEIERLRNTNPAEYLARRESCMIEDKTKGKSEIDTMNSPAIQSLLQNGYGESLVKQAVTIFQKRNRGKSFSAKELLEIIFDIEDNNIPFEESEKKDDPVVQTDNLVIKENEELRKSTYCRKCSTSFASVVFLPCGHLCTCSDCAPSIKHCLLCNQFIKGTVRTYLA